MVQVDADAPDLEMAIHFRQPPSRRSHEPPPPVDRAARRMSNAHLGGGRVPHHANYSTAACRDTAA
jgi:hypothetical protein